MADLDMSQSYSHNFSSNFDLMYASPVNSQRVLASIRNNESRFVIDCRYLHLHTGVNAWRTIYQQLSRILQKNREEAKIPFQIHLCNCVYRSEFAHKYFPGLDLTKNLVQDTRQSYTDLFPKEKLVLK